MKYNVLIIHNIVSPYRIPFFEALSNHPLVNLHVCYCAKKHKNRQWKIIDSEQYNYSFLSGITIEIYDITYHINPSIIIKLFRCNFDVVIIGGNTDFTTQIAFFVSKLLNIPIILWSEGIKSAQSNLGKFISPLTRLIIKHSDAIVVPGTLSRDFHIEQGAIPEKIFIAPNIVNNDLFIKQSLEFKKDKLNVKKALNFNDKNIIIIFVGQLIERKGIKYLIQAYQILCKEFPNIALIVVGDGPLKESLSNKCDREKVPNIYFTGWISETEKILYYSIADVFVFPTLEDVWGLVVNEAMACSLPVISTNAAGCTFDMISIGENGFIVDAKDPHQLYSEIKKILSDEVCLKSMRSKSLNKIQTVFNVDNMVAGFISAIKYVSILGK